MFDSLKKVGSASAEKVCNMGKTTAVMGITALTAVSAMAADPVVLPETGVDVGAYISAGILALGAVVGVAVGGYIAFLIIRKALRWSGRSMG